MENKNKPDDTDISYSVGNGTDIDKGDLKFQEERYKQDTEERKSLFLWVRRVVSIWLFFTALALFFNGFNIIELSDVIVCTL